MFRLYDQAFEILKTELEKNAQKDLVGEVGRTIILKRLEKLRSQSGEPLTLDELQNLVSDQFPDFNKSVLKQASTAYINKFSEHPSTCQYKFFDQFFVLRGCQP